MDTEWMNAHWALTLTIVFVAGLTCSVVGALIGNPIAAAIVRLIEKRSKGVGA